MAELDLNLIPYLVALEEMRNVVDKARSTGNDSILVCERGFSFISFLFCGSETAAGKMDPDPLILFKCFYYFSFFFFVLK